MNPLIWTGIAVAVAAAASVAKAADHDDKGGDDMGNATGREHLTALLQAAPLDSTQRGFFLWVAWGESRFQSQAKNHTASEAAAAARSYDRHPDHYAACDYPRADFVRGSEGYFQILIPVGLWVLRKTPFKCWDPKTYLLDPAKSLTAAIALARGLQGWKGFQSNPTVGNLRRGWGWPAKMGPGQPDPDKRKKYEAQLRKSGLASASFLDETIARMPGNYAAIYEALRKV